MSQLTRTTRGRAARTGAHPGGLRATASTRRTPARAKTGARKSFDPIAALRADHRKVERLFKQAQVDPDVFDEIRDALEIHALVEEEIFYPAVRNARGDKGEELVEQAEREHAEVKALVIDLDRMDREGKEFAGKLRELQEMVQLHVAAEESAIFREARHVLTQEQFVALFMRMDDRKRKAMAR